MDTYIPVIAVDFDGTLCTNNWPEIGEPNELLITLLKGAKETGGIKLILWTCRTGELLDNAVAWCKERGLEFDAVNENLPEDIEYFGSDSRKVRADCYVDDKSCTPDSVKYAIEVALSEGRNTVVEEEPKYEQMNMFDYIDEELDKQRIDKDGETFYIYKGKA